jgi:GDP/UDP-N,N'-diacetylbacillosamine 2-epimerase (hydrolysing)
LGLDNIQKLQLLNQAEFEDSIGVKLQRKNLLITFHPVTLEDNTSEKHFQELLDALDSLQDTLLIFTKANADNNGRIINQMIDAYCSRNVQKSIAFHSLGSLRFLSALQYMDAMVGNSSSGLIEAPAFKLATINIGDRQKGRVKAKSVLDCAPNKAAVQAAIRSVYSVGFQAELQQVDSPYGTGGASATIIDIIKKVNLKDILQKKFYNLDRG